MSSDGYLQFTPAAAAEAKKLPESERWNILRDAGSIHVGLKIVYPGLTRFVVLEVSDSRILLGLLDQE